MRPAAGRRVRALRPRRDRRRPDAGDGRHAAPGRARRHRPCPRVRDDRALYDAATLERWNVVNRVLPDDGFDAAAREFAMGLAAGPTKAHAATKAIVRAQVGGGARAADAIVPEVGRCAVRHRRPEGRGPLVPGRRPGQGHLRRPLTAKEPAPERRNPQHPEVFRALDASPDSPCSPPPSRAPPSPFPPRPPPRSWRSARPTRRPRRAARPGPCLAVSRTTGYQAKVGADRGLMTIPADGRIVAWTIGLGKPGKKQTAFFDSKLGGPASAPDHDARTRGASCARARSARASCRSSRPTSAPPRSSR